MYSVSAKIVKPPGEKPDDFEASISQVSIFNSWLSIVYVTSEKMFFLFELTTVRSKVEISAI